MKEKINKKIELVGIKENEIDESNEKINKELEGLTREELEEYKMFKIIFYVRFEAEILNSDPERIEEELKITKLIITE